LSSDPVAYIGLGANLAAAGATPAQALHAAIDGLAALPQTRLEASSRLYISDPVDADGPPYFNQVARLQTRLTAQSLLDHLQSIERGFGRERPYRNAPRTLDLDLLLLGDQTIDTPRLVVPHPRMHERLFVLMPLAELDPGLVIPGRGKVTDHLDALQATRTQRCAPAH
jgi:2-amino-4-hydroxy-6-hydroxymethyldihydropteridine diphosphokinase